MFIFKVLFALLIIFTIVKIENIKYFLLVLYLKFIILTKIDFDNFT